MALDKDERAPLGLVLKPDHPINDASRVGVCFSGGGLRSASWCLGAIQALKQEQTWEEVDVVAAVSGGSYIAASHAIAVDKAQPNELNADESPLVRPVYSRGSAEERFLKNRSSYLLSGNGVKWRAITSVLYGTLFGLGGLMLAIFVISRPIGWLYAGSTLDWSGGYKTPSGWQVMVPVLLAGCAVVAIIAERWINTRPLPESEGQAKSREALSRFLRLGATDRPQGERRWRGLGRLLVFLSVLAAVLLLVIPMLLGWLNDPDQENWVGSLIAELSAGVGSGGDAANRPSIAVLVLLASLIGTVMKGVLGRKEARPLVFRVASAVILPLLLIFLSLKWIDGALAVAADPQWELSWPAPWAVEFVTLVTAVVLIELMWVFYDANRASLHPFYRERLSSAFVMRRRKDGVAEEIPYADPLPVTALRYSRGREEQIPPPDVGRGGRPERRKKSRRPSPSTGDRATGAQTPHQPVLVVVAAANVRDTGAVPPGREAVPFIFETCAENPEIGIPATAAGLGKGQLPGMRPARFVQDLMPREVTLPAAMAISGAAFSPIMGTMDRPSLRLLMALFNLRLGLWLPNPYHLDQGTPRAGGTGNNAGEHRDSSKDSGSSKKSVRRPGYRYLWNEMRGHSSIEDDYLYVSDGGHYENLGLVELLRRGCTEIYCFDASGQPPGRLASLGHSMAIAKEELDVEFGDFAKPEFNPESGLTTNLCTDIPYHYLSADGSRSHDGDYLIHYLPLGVEKDSPHDVREYQLEQASGSEDDEDHTKQWRFPWDSIGDQIFDHRQFEAYRALGESATKHMLKQERNNGAPRSPEETPDGALAGPPSPW